MHKSSSEWLIVALLAGCGLALVRPGVAPGATAVLLAASLVLFAAAAAVFALTGGRGAVSRGFARFLAAAAVLFLFLAGAELTARWRMPAAITADPYGLDPEPDSAAAESFRKDPWLGSTYRPGFVGRFRHPEYGAERVAVNEDGFRDPPWPAAGEGAADAPRLLFLGDSMTVGLGVEEHERFTSLLERALRARTGRDELRCFTAAVPGWGPGQCVLLARRLMDRLRPTIVVAAFYDGNDLEDARALFMVTRNRGLHAMILPSEQLALAGRVDVAALRVSPREPDPAVLDARWWRGRSALYQWIEERASGLFARAGWLAPDAVWNYSMLRAMRPDPDVEVADNLWLTHRSFELLAEGCAGAGAVPVVLRIPSKLQTELETFERLLRELRLDEASFDRARPGAAVLEAAGAAGTATLDLLPRLEEFGRGFAANPAYYREGHPSRRGHEVIAAELERFLLQEARTRARLE